MENAGGQIESTTLLLRELRAGRSEAREELVRRYLPLLTSWARGRLPRRGRSLAETDDLVQVTFLRALNNLERFEAARPGAFLGYLRTILLNSVREELRRSQRLPRSEALSEALAGDGPSVVEEAIGAELLDEYEQALATTCSVPNSCSGITPARPAPSSSRARRCVPADRQYPRCPANGQSIRPPARRRSVRHRPSCPRR